MSTDKRLNRRVPEHVRREDTPGIRIDSGPFIGIVKNNVDPIRGGRIQVWIPELGTAEDDPKGWRTVRYASPYYGATTQTRNESNSYENVVHSYGMWAVVPDIGNQVICTFIAGDPGRGYWFACINPNLSHYMMPGLAAGNEVDTSETSANLKSKYNATSSKWPVAEFNQNKKENLDSTWINNSKPVHELQANILINQGLDRDGIRGAITSSSQRESPSNVFGISTPGRPLNDPADDPTYDERLKSGKLTAGDLEIRARKGGHTFVMDDGDQKGKDQLVRLRTAGGHQILMNDTEKVMYVANSTGAVWLEFTAGGHVNVYSQAGIHMRTEGELNLHADKDINIQSGGSIRMKSAISTAFQTKDLTVKASGSLTAQAGKIGMLSDGAFNVQAAGFGVNSSGQLVLKGSKILLNTETPPGVPPVRDLAVYKQADTRFVDGLWNSEPNTVESIATFVPAHEPWPRASTATPEANQFVDPVPEVKPESVCPPIGPVAVPLVNKLKPTGVGGAGPFGDYIASLESGRASYNAFNRGSNPPPGTGSPREQMDLVNMTIDQILALQALSDPFKRLFAVGRYQCIPSTLRDACRVLKIPTSSLFSQQVQDNIFINYLCKGKQPAIRAYLEGADQNNETLLLRACSATAAEWASVEDPLLPPPRGRYDGVGTNKAKGKTAETKLALRSQWAALRSGTYPVSVVTTGTGGVLTDSSGNPVTSGNTGVDAGIANARSKSVKFPAPPESMKKQDIPTPRSISAANGQIPGLTAIQVKSLMVQIGYSESQLEYDAVDDSLGRIGRYLINGKLLRDYGYIKPDYVKEYGNQAVFRPDAYTGKDGITSSSAWLNSPGIQDQVMETILRDFYSRMTKLQSIKLGDDVCTVAGMLAVAYFYRDNEALFGKGGPTDKAKFWREQGGNPGTRGENGETPFNQGRYALDVLSIAE